MKVKMLSSQGYSTDIQDYGDCILVDNGVEVLVYDCGSEAHAKRVEEYLRQRQIKKAIVVLSHNDDDHFKGIPYLVEQNLVSCVYTILFDQHIDELLAELNDGRRTHEGVRRAIEEIYDNVTDLAKNYDIPLVDTLTEPVLINDVTVIGPTKEYAIQALAQKIKDTDRIDHETVVNAVSVQISLISGIDHILLCGDSSFDAIEDILTSHKVVQLPHHGKPETAEQIFAKKRGENDAVYLVSDNKGNASGGSGELDVKGHNVLNTRNGDIEYPVKSTTLSGLYTGRTLGCLCCDMF